ncbi:putative SIT4 phosphatase-associated protein family [Helianthus annuus]|nr:putative SIT4 phosphatase-associated protein family [Helianthus annuus]
MLQPILPAEGRTPPRIGNVGHMTCIANKLIEQGANITYIESYLQGDSEWVEWHTGVLAKRNALENVYQWACGRQTSLHDRGRDSDDDEYQDRDYDMAALVNNLRQAFRYCIYENDDNDEVYDKLVMFLCSYLLFIYDKSALCFWLYCISSMYGFLYVCTIGF